MSTNGANHNLNPSVSPTAGAIAKAGTNGKTCLLNHLLREALFTRNRELNELHRIYDLMFRPFQIRPWEVLALEDQNDGTNAGVNGMRPHHLQHLHAARFRCSPSVEPVSFATLELKTILAVLLERLHLFVPYRAALIRLGNGTSARPLDTVACRVWHGGIHDKRTAQSYKLLADTVLKRSSDFPMDNIQKTENGRGSAFLQLDTLHRHLGMPLIADGQLLGVLSIFLQANTSLGHRKIKMLKLLAAQAASVIQTSLTYEGLQKHLLESAQDRQDNGARSMPSRQVEAQLKGKRTRTLRRTKLESNRSVEIVS